MIPQSLPGLITVGLVLVSAAQATGVQSGSAHRRAHKLLKRVPAPAPVDKEGTVAAANAPPADGAQVVPVTTTYAALDLFHQTPLVGYTTIYPSSSQTAPSSSSSPWNPAGSIIGDPAGLQHSAISISTATATSASSSASNSSTTASSTSSKASSTSKAATSTSKPLSSSESIPAENKTITRTAVVGAPAETGTPDVTPPPVGAASLPVGARNVLITLGAVIVGIVAIWFVVRKTKFGKSRDRMNPEDWAPPMEEHDRSYDPSAIRRQSAASSFHSGGGARDDMFAISDHGHGHSSAYPERDYTAGTGASAPIGVYADLARGESPTQSVYEQQYIPSAANHHQQAAAYDYRAEGHHF